MSHVALDTGVLIDIPTYVATMGVTDGPLGHITHGFVIRTPQTGGTGLPNVPPNNIGSLITEANRDWWIRENQNDPLHGPLTYQQAVAGAKYLSRREDKSGLAQVCTYLGSRGGDPIKDPTQLFVVFMYIKGKRTLAGRMAEYHSDRDLPEAPQ